MKRREFLTTATKAFTAPILVQQPLTEKPGKTRSDSSSRDGRKQEKQKKAPSSATGKKPPARSDDNNPFGKAGEEQEEFFTDLPEQLLDVKKLVTLGLGVSAVGGGIYYIKQRQRQASVHGDAHFASRKEVRHLLRSFNKSLPAGEIAIGQFADSLFLPERLLVLDRRTALCHVLTLGPSGSGKSRSIFLINCLYNWQTSFVATDPKSELWSHTAARQARAIRFAPSDPDNSMSFNFVPLCKDTAIADRLTDAIIYAQGKRHGDVYWENAERQLLKVLLIHAAHSATPVLTYVYELICADHQVLSKILTASPVATVRREARPYIEGTEHYRTGAKSGVKQKLKWLDNEKIRRFTSSTKEAFDFSVLRRVPTQIYWCLEEDDVTRLQQLTAVFFNLMLSVLKRAEGNVPVNLFFDEFGNIGRLNDFEKDITLLRGRDIAIIAGLQSYSQLEVLYGKAEAEIIYDNFNSKIVLGGLEGEMAERLSRAMGEYTHREKRKSYSRQGGIFSPKTTVTEGEHFYERRLMKPQEIRQLSPKKLLLPAMHLSPVILDRLRFEEEPQALNKHRCPRELEIENLADRKPPKPKPRDTPPPPLPQGLLPKK